VRERPVLCTLRALALFFSDRPQAAEAALQEAERRLQGSAMTDEARAVLGRAAVIRAALARFSGDLPRCVAFGRQALEMLPPTEATARERAAASVAVTLGFHVSGNVSPAADTHSK